MLNVWHLALVELTERTVASLQVKYLAKKRLSALVPSWRLTFVSSIFALREPTIQAFDRF